ncbi:MAG TPA: hypothetical protein VFW33_01400, partial [Gemmataceae bacterium]|nr:hypothetical protein [Gemmataceae bacterium]
MSLVLAAARSDFSDVYASRVRAAAPGVDWESLWALARGHGVGWLVATNVRKLSDGAGRRLLPETVEAAWQRDLWRDAAGALLLAHAQTGLDAAVE